MAFQRIEPDPDDWYQTRFLAAAFANVMAGKGSKRYEADDFQFKGVGRKRQSEDEMKAKMAHIAAIQNAKVARELGG